MSYRVTAPLVLVKVPLGVNDYRVDYHYAGSVIPWLSDAQREHFLAEGMVVSADDLDDTTSGHAGDPGGRPKQTALKEAWVDYRASQGVDRAEAEGLSKQELIDLGE